MYVRLADIEKDALAIMDGARDFVSRLDFKDFLPETDEAFVEAVGRVITLPGVEVVVAETDKIVGGIGMIYGPHLWNPAILAADEVFWWTAEDAPATAALRLLRFAVARVRERGALPTFKRLTASPEGVDGVYRRMGLKPVEISYSGVL